MAASRFPSGGSGSGDVTGPGSATSGRVVLFDGTSGKLIKQASAETGAGAPVFADTPTLITPELGEATAVSVVATDSLEAPTVLLDGVTVVNLPAVPAAGMMAYVTDSATVTWGATITGGSTNKVLAWFNGTNWTVAGK